MTAERQNDLTSELALLRVLVDSRKEEYRELSDLWRNVDTKAQGVIALAGILLAAFIALIAKVQSSPGQHVNGELTALGLVLSLLAVCLLTASMICSVLSLKLRKSAGSPYLNGSLRTAVEDLLLIKETDRTDRMPGLLREYCGETPNRDPYQHLSPSEQSGFLFKGGVCLLNAIRPIREL